MGARWGCEQTPRGILQNQREGGCIDKAFSNFYFCSPTPRSTNELHLFYPYMISVERRGTGGNIETGLGLGWLWGIWNEMFFLLFRGFMDKGKTIWRCMKVGIPPRGRSTLIV